MTEFENIFEEANKKNAKEAPPPKAAPAATEKKSDVLRDDRRSVWQYRRQQGEYAAVP